MQALFYKIIGSKLLTVSKLSCQSCNPEFTNLSDWAAHSDKIEALLGDGVSKATNKLIRLVKKYTLSGKATPTHIIHRLPANIKSKSVLSAYLNCKSDRNL